MDILKDTTILGQSDTGNIGNKEVPDIVYYDTKYTFPDDERSPF